MCVSFSEGRWRVMLRTNALPSAGTQAQVKINVYGDKGNSGDITLGNGDGKNFQPGYVDEFDVSLSGKVESVFTFSMGECNTILSAHTLYRHLG